MTPEQEMRAIAVQAASHVVKENSTPRVLAEYAEHVAEYIKTGELPSPPEGVFWS